MFSPGREVTGLPSFSGRSFGGCFSGRVTWTVGRRACRSLPWSVTKVSAPVRHMVSASTAGAAPPPATAQATNSGSVTVRGVRDGVQCISCNIPYLVLNHAPVPGQQTDPAESVWKQYADKLIPAGGSTGQVLAKASAQDMDLYWADGTTTQTETTPHMLTNAGRSKKKAIVSFVDDDCRSEAYTVLFPLVQELGMPYTVACPAGLMGKTGRMTVEQLQEMARSGVTVACHTMTETDMEQDTPETLEATLQQFEAEMRRWGIRGVRSYAYVNGRYKADCLNTVKKHFDLGLTVEKGINQIPYESCRMKRVEVFPKNKSYTLEDVKAWVDKAVQDGGWLILMTHAWYTTFDAAQLKELVGYIRASGAELMDLYDALDATGNVVEAVRQTGAPLVGLSALMTTTVPNMQATIEALHAANLPCKVMVGGAVLTKAYAEQIGADFYAKDAKASADYAKQIFG